MLLAGAETVETRRLGELVERSPVSLRQNPSWPLESGAQGHQLPGAACLGDLNPSLFECMFNCVTVLRVNLEPHPAICCPFSVIAAQHRIFLFIHTYWPPTSAPPPSLPVIAITRSLDGRINLPYILVLAPNHLFISSTTFSPQLESLSIYPGNTPHLSLHLCRLSPPCRTSSSDSVPRLHIMTG